MMAREKFAARRPTTTINIQHSYRGADPRSLCVSYSRLDDGRIGEIWVNSINGHEKLVNDDMRDACVAVSKDLQNGDTIEWLAKSILRDGRSKPLGWMGAVLDALKREPVDA